MDLTNISNWLRSTIPGIIILGAFGSILAVILIKLLSKIGRALIKLFITILPTQASRARNWIMAQKRKMIFEFGEEFGRRTLGDVRGIVAYFAFHISRAAAWLVAFAVCLFLVMTIMISRRSLLLTIGTFILVVLSMLSLYRAFIHLIAITLAYRHSPAYVNPSREELQRTLEAAKKYQESLSSVGEKKEETQSERKA